MIVNQVQRSMQPPWGLGHAGLGWSFAQEPSPLPATPQQPGTISAGRVLGTLFVTALGFAAVGFGAYAGAKESRKWAAGGAIIGNLAATGLLLLTSAIAAQARTTP